MGARTAFTTLQPLHLYTQPHSICRSCARRCAFTSCRTRAAPPLARGATFPQFSTSETNRIFISDHSPASPRHSTSAPFVAAHLFAELWRSSFTRCRTKWQQCTCTFPIAAAVPQHRSISAQCRSATQCVLARACVCARKRTSSNIRINTRKCLIDCLIFA